MEETLRQLQEYQLAALKKGIAYDIDIFIDGEKVPDISVKMLYSVTQPVYDMRSFHTTFSNDVEDRVSKMKLGLIKKFIEDVNKD